MSLFLPIILCSIFNPKGVYVDSDDSVKLAKQEIRIQSDSEIHNFKLSITQSNACYYFEIKSYCKQLLFFSYSLNKKQNLWSDFSNVQKVTYVLNIGPGTIKHKVLKKELDLGMYACSIKPGYTREFFFVYHFY